ncbi:hypothetical protein GCM10007096_09340 [Pullulanibacillus pueri]|uniref:Uncharacterized protein n=1 Tax=Pullulanibacillus pueri TaxID=1437324 RepID=A0A8J3EKJ2_9BACL|nr:hypothetical protein GCM10007096_09340 [Pullulanibacillus pueri]
MSKLLNNKETKGDKIRSFLDNLFESCLGCLGVGYIIPIILSVTVVGLVFWIIQNFTNGR